MRHHRRRALLQHRWNPVRHEPRRARAAGATGCTRREARLAVRTGNATSGRLVWMYTCGITPYIVTHVGHASTFVWTDLIGRSAHAAGSDVLLARNVTDSTTCSPAPPRPRAGTTTSLALTQEFLFERDMKALRVAALTHSPHVRSHITAAIRCWRGCWPQGTPSRERRARVVPGGHVPEAAGLTRVRARVVPGLRRPGRRRGPRVGVRRRGLAAQRGGRIRPGRAPGVGETGPARRVCRDGDGTYGSAIDALVGRRGPRLPAPPLPGAMVEAASGVTPFARSPRCTWGRSGSTAPRWPSRPATWSWWTTCSTGRGSAVRLGLLHRRWSRELRRPGLRGGRGPARAAAPGGVYDRRPPRHHPTVLSRLFDELDVQGAVALALDEGGDAAAYLLDVLKRATRSDPRSRRPACQR